jgi:hypothetical protein
MPADQYKQKWFCFVKSKSKAQVSQKKRRRKENASPEEWDELKLL